MTVQEMNIVSGGLDSKAAIAVAALRVSLACLLDRECNIERSQKTWGFHVQGDLDIIIKESYFVLMQRNEFLDRHNVL